MIHEKVEYTKSFYTVHIYQPWLNFFFEHFGVIAFELVLDVIKLGEIGKTENKQTRKLMNNLNNHLHMLEKCFFFNCIYVYIYI